MAGVRFCAVLLACALAMGSAAAQGGDARAAMADGRYIDALAAYAEAIAAAPEDAGVYAQRASLFSVLGQPDLAALDYRSAVKLRPDDAALQLNLCLNLALANHHLDGALAACNAAVKIAPGNYEALSARGYAELRRGAWAAAEKDFAAALAINAASPNEMFGHGLAVIHLGRAQAGRDEIASATLDSAGLVNEWGAKGFGARGEIKPGKAVTTAAQAIASVDDSKVFLNANEGDPGGPCRWIYPKVIPANAKLSLKGSTMSGGDCRFGLMHGEWTHTSEDTGVQVMRFAYGRHILPGAEGEALERKLTLAYQAAEKALAP